MLGITNVSNAPSIVLKDTVVSSWTALPSTGTDSDMKTQGYTYYASVPCNGISENTLAEVTFSDAQAKSGNYAPVCRTYADEVRVYSKVNTSITIPSIIIHSIVESYYEMDNSPVSGSTNAVTSGGVYDAIHDVEFFNVSGANGIVINNQYCWAYNNIVHIDIHVYNPTAGAISGGTVLASIPDAYLPPIHPNNNYPFFEIQFLNGANVYGGIMWSNRKGVFLDSSMPSGATFRLSYTYPRN